VSAKERARRVACKNNARQFLTGVHMYGDDFSQQLATGASDSGPLDDHIPILMTNARKAILEYTRTGKVLECPSLGPPFGQPDGWGRIPYGVVVGYNYLGGHTNTPWPACSGTRTPGRPRKS
jgi:hypothetical protein